MRRLEPRRFRSGWWGGVGAIVAVILGGWLYVQQRDLGKRRALDDRETALMAGFEQHVIAPRPAGGVVVETGPLVALRGTIGPGTVLSLPEDPAAAELAAQSGAFTPPAALGSAMSPPNEQPAAPSQEPPPGSVTPLPPRRPLQIRIATPPRAVPLPALLRRRESP